jgi:hypothetical protein
VGSATATVDFTSVFNRLSPTQLDVLCNVAFGGDGGFCNLRTLKSLADKGLIERADEAQSGGFTAHKWAMPLHVHIAFCEWCSANVATTSA